MRIAIDARWIFKEISGIGSYTRELIRQLPRLDSRNTYVLLFNDAALQDRTLGETALTGAANVETQLFGYGVFSPFSQLLLPRRLRHCRIDLYHSTNYMIPFAAFPRSSRAIRCVVSVHDVIPLVMPDHAPRSRKARLFPLYRRLMAEVGARADAIITGSHFSRADVIKYLGIPESAADKVRTVYDGVAERFQPPVRRRAKTPQEPRTLLYVGRCDPYKNLATLLRAFAEARKTSPFSLGLTIAGSPDPRYPEPRRLATELGIDTAVHWTGYLSDDALLSLYQHADVLVHPSRYEGFGLQVLEAMATGLPVICSDAASLPEVAGDAAILVPPDDVQGFARRIVEVLANPRLAEDLTRNGLRQAARFTWTRTAEETLAVYQSLGGTAQV